jgi:hypothetical protein
MDLVTPGGRLIEGSMSVPSLKDYEGNVRDRPQYYFALAVDKRDPSIAPILAQIWNTATTYYAQIPDVMRRINMGLDPYSRFAWKICDGDHAKFSDKPLYKGMYVFKFSTTYPLKTCGRDNLPIEPATVKLGWYADVAFSVKPNARIDGNAGLFVNPLMVRILGLGEEIITGPAPEKLFGAAPAPTMGTPLGATTAPAAAYGFGGGNATSPLGVASTAVPAHLNQPASSGLTGGGLAPSVQHSSPTMGNGYVGTAAPSMTPQPATPSGFVQPAVAEQLSQGTVTSPLVSPASVQDVQGGATFPPAQTLGMTAPVSASETVSHFSPPSIPGFSSGAVE